MAAKLTTVNQALKTFGISNQSNLAEFLSINSCDFGHKHFNRWHDFPYCILIAKFLYWSVLCLLISAGNLKPLNAYWLLYQSFMSVLTVQRTQLFFSSHTQEFISEIASQTVCNKISVLKSTTLWRREAHKWMKLSFTFFSLRKAILKENLPNFNL